MRIDQPGLVLLGAVAVLGIAVLLALTWDRRGKIWRSALMAVSVLVVAATAGLQLNRMTEAYPSWAALVGQAPRHPAQAEAKLADGGGAASSPEVSGGSRMVTLTVPGPASGLNLTMYVYLPVGYAQSPRTAFPVIEATHGYPGTAVTWVRKLRVQHYLDTEIAAGRMAPTVVIFPMQTPRALLDTECTNLVHGPQTETYLTTDVPAYVRAHFHVRTDRGGWGLIGYSAGGFCTNNLLLRHPDRYAAGASLSGYASPGIAVGDGSEKTYNNPAWRLQHLPQPPVSLFLAWANDDKTTRRDSLRLAALAHSPVQVTTATVAHGGHSHAVWEQMEAPAFDWLSAHLARPATS
ncbi:alpha/beta hydrolase [Actinoplanes sp. NPDC051343]|uniref:alpha/beta hydrolase n=1 Tax=Actinoplanes sp. NPDC051343 TaxID=3363906 RepID=UPI0037AC12F1